jgi:hypothetical protein
VKYAVASDTGAIYYSATGNWTDGVSIGSIGVVASLTSADFRVNDAAAAGILTPNKALTASEMNTAFTAYSGTAATADLTGFSAAQLAEVVIGAADFAAGGITGTVSLTAAQSHSLVTALNSSATVTVSDTGSAINTGLANIVADIAKIDTIDASDATAIVLAVADATAITNTKLTLGDTVNLTDTAGNITGVNGLLAAAFANIDTVTVADTSSAINTAKTAITTNIGSIDKIDSSDTLILALADLFTNAKLTAADTVQVTMAASATLASATNIDKVDVGVAGITGTAQANLAAVDATGEWYFATPTLSFWNGSAAVNVTLTGVASVASVASGVFTL